MTRALLTLLACAVVLAGCDNNDPAALADVPPTVSTAPVTGICMEAATTGGQVMADGGAPVTARGVVWGSEPNPTFANRHTIDGTGTGAFVSEIAGLSPETTYYVRAYALNRAGTAYGEEISFTTKAGEYAIRVLGRVDGHPTLGNSLNEQCQVAGSYHLGNNRFGSYVWAPGTGFRKIDMPGDGSAYAINQGGTVVGGVTVDGVGRAYSWSEADGFRLYPMPDGAAAFTGAMGSGINSQGVIAGTIWGSDFDEAAVLWHPDGEAVVLRRVSRTTATGINEAGVVVGTAHAMPAIWRAPDEDPVRLQGNAVGQGWGINQRGDVVGVGGVTAMDLGAGLWRDGQHTRLIALPGHDAAIARSLTDPDTDNVIRAVGWSEPVAWGGAVARRPVLWTVDGSHVHVADLYPPPGHLGAIAKEIKILQGEVVIIGTSYTQDSAFAVMWSTSRDVCGP
jgi:hypothetical protein